MRAFFTPGASAKRSKPNMRFTPSVDNWIRLLDQVAAMDIDTILPPHGDIATRADVKERAAMVTDEYAVVKDAVNRGVTVEQATTTLTLPQYQDWRNPSRKENQYAKTRSSISPWESHRFTQIGICFNCFAPARESPKTLGSNQSESA
jgi:hypothetical protein